MATIKMSDALWTTAESIVSFAKKAGINISIMDVYNKESIEQIALISSFIKELAIKGAKCDIEVIKD